VRRLLLLALLVCWLPPARGDEKGEVARLQGTWRPVDLERRGDPGAAAFRPAACVVIKGNTLRFQVGERVLQELHFTLGPARAPRAIDLVSASGPTKGKTLRGIYRLEGDRLTLCWPLDGDAKRPAGFGAEAAGDVVTFTLQREAPPVARVSAR
jgi:uncharacterized protein (TIGR03067 family)